MKNARLGIIGVGNIGKFHAEYLLKGGVSRCELKALCSRDTTALPKQFPGLKLFNRGEDLIQSGMVDAVLIATPHWQHLPLGIAAFAQGVHVLMEKPIAAHKADAARLIEAHQKFPGVVFGAMYQFRTEPRYQKIRELVKSEMGGIVRVNWIITDWYRTEAYYRSSAWRATWRGEGGGVLLNQCLHNLDLLQWLCGMPKRVRGFCQFGRFHQIEVEDNVTVYLEWANGATGTVISSTGEAPGANRLEIVGTRSTLVLEDNRLRLKRNAVDMIQFSQTATEGFLKPDCRTEDIPFGSATENATLPHARITQNFVDAIHDGTPLIAPGAEGIHALELANAMTYSSLLNETVELPLDGAAWENKLKQLM